MKLRSSTVAIVSALALLFPSLALAQRAGPVQAQGEPMSEAAAVAFLNAFFAEPARVRFTMCGARVRENSPITTYEISATHLRITFCEGATTQDVAFVDFPHVALRQGEICVRSDAHSEYNLEYNGCVEGLMFSRPEDVQGFANAWLALAHPPPRDPATDTAFQTALQTAHASGVDRTEENRRVQVQVEALLGANRADEAATRYREALIASPDWADGHYNLALVAGELGEHTEAITAMRRYLYLNPSAADARAAQDQIYRWEALMSEGMP
jgi:tetratricopeptide (TPR) repeat protein